MSYFLSFDFFGRYASLSKQHFIECPYTMSLYPNNAAQCQLPKLQTEAVFLVMCDPFINELCVTWTSLCIDLYGSSLLTAHS